MLQFTEEQIKFLNKSNTAILTIYDRYKKPVGIPIWALYYESAIYMGTFSSSKKIQYIIEHPKISVLVMEQPRGWPYLRLIGEAEVFSQKEMNKLLEFSNFKDFTNRIARKYVEPDKIADYFKSENEYSIIKLQPERIEGSIKS